MTLVEALGWAGAAMTIVTYAMRTMVPLRIAAITSNVLFLIYAIMIGSVPLIVMDLLLLPFNIWRLAQIFALRRQIRVASASEGLDFSVLRHIGDPQTLPAGVTVFRKGDPPDRLYVLDSGRIELEETGIVLEGKDIFGEIAFFTDARERTATARCLTECRVYAIDEQVFLELYFQRPGFAMALMRLITRRLIENVSREAGGAPAPRPAPDLMPAPAV